MIQTFFPSFILFFIKKNKLILKILKYYIYIWKSKTPASKSKLDLTLRFCFKRVASWVDLAVQLGRLLGDGST